MKTKYILLTLFFISNLLYSQSEKKPILSILFNSGQSESITLYVENNNDNEIEISNTIDGSFWCLTKPCVEFELEENRNGTWSKINYDITNNKRCGDYSDWKKNNKKTIIKQGEKKEIGSFYFHDNLSGWFGFFGNKKLRLTVKYTIEGDDLELSNYGLNSIELLSSPLEIEYVNAKHPVDYLKFYKKLLSENKLTKKRFRQGARTIKYPGDDKKRIILALKIFGIRIDDLEDKILPIVISDFSTDTENPAIITTNVINDGGKFYLISFIRFSRYGLEEVYTKDFCQIYKVN